MLEEEMLDLLTFCLQNPTSDELESKIKELQPSTVAAFVAETVVGATSGAVPPVPGYFKRIREICDRYGVLLILDEIMCGFGRTGTWFACEQEGVVPDMITIAKGLAAGYQPIGALLVKGKLYEQIKSCNCWAKSQCFYKKCI